MHEELIQIADRITQAVAEIPDRFSPEDDPRMMLVRDDELRSIVQSVLEAEVARLRALAVPLQRADHARAEMRKALDQAAVCLQQGAIGKALEYIAAVDGIESALAVPESAAPPPDDPDAETGTADDRIAAPVVDAIRAYIAESAAPQPKREYRWKFTTTSERIGWRYEETDCIERGPEIVIESRTKAGPWEPLDASVPPRESADAL